MTTTEIADPLTAPLAEVLSIPAATLVLFRDGPTAPEHLFLERATTMTFAGGAVVFPGGRVDPGDRALAVRHSDLDPDDAASRVAAIRETIEEAGVAVGLSGDVDIDAMRLNLAQGAAFGDLLDAAALTLDLSGLTPFARWCPRFKQERSFDTRFYVAAAPDGADASVDETENVHLFWASAQVVLDRAGRDELKIIFPTRRNLERLASLADLAAARADAAAHPVVMITPWIEERAGVKCLCIPEALGYPITAEALSGAVRA